MAKPKGTLYVAAIDIGNSGDATMRVIETLRTVDLVFVESFKEGSKTLKRFGLQKELRELNEHTTPEEISAYAMELLEKTAALISDAGAPLMEDPGLPLVQKAHEYHIRVVALPGASALTATIMVCPFSMKRFLYAGLLPRENSARIRELAALSRLPYPVVIFEAPYRLPQLIGAIANAYPSERELFIAFDLTMENETLFLGTVREAAAQFLNEKKKRVFVVVLNGNAYAERRKR